MNARTPIGFHATSAKALAYQPPRSMTRSEAITLCIDNQDSTDVLEALVASGALDDSLVNDMLEANHERRLAERSQA